MKFVRVNSLVGLSGCVQPLADRLLRELKAHTRVLWLVTGGSSISVAVAVMKQIPDDLSARLAVYLTDERFGPVGHPDSNFQQLMDAGFKPKGATVVGVLMPGVAFEETIERYANAVKTGFAAADVIIGQFGIGDDGHISGILPDSPAVKSTELVYGYKTPTYDRITTTFTAMKKMTAVYAFAVGTAKLQAVSDLKNKDLPLASEPSQILKQLPESYVFTDQIETDNTDDKSNVKGESI